MNAHKYLAAKMRHTQSGRDAIVLDLFAAAIAAGPTGYSIDDAVRLFGHTKQETRMALDEMKERDEVQQVDEKWMQTIHGRQTAEKIFKVSTEERHFDKALFWIGQLIDSVDPKDFREANSWKAEVQRENQKSL